MVNVKRKLIVPHLAKVRMDRTCGLLYACAALTCVFSQSVYIRTTCHSCTIDDGCKSVSTINGMSLEGCQDLLLHYTRAHYASSTGTCKVTNCEDLAYTTAGEDSLLMFEDSTVVCPDIYLRKNSEIEVEYGDKRQLSSVSLTQCFFECADDASCVFFTYKESGHECTLDLDCGPRCMKKQDAQDFDVYSVTCVPSCPTLPLGYSDLHVYMYTVTVGSAVVYYCSPDKIVRPLESTSRVCQEDGTWTGTEPICVDGNTPSCPSLTDPPDGSISMYPDGTRWAVYTFSAAVLSMTPTDRRTCRSDNTWTLPVPGVQIGTTTTATTTTTTPTTTTTTPTTTTSILTTTTISPTSTTTPTTTATSTRTTSPSSTTSSTTTASTTSTTTTTTRPTAAVTTPQTTITTIPMTSTTSATASTTQPLTPTTTTTKSTTIPTTTTTTAGPSSAPTTQIPSFGPPNLSNVTTEALPPRIYIIPCICVANSLFANMTEREIIEYLDNATRIDKRATSRANRKLISASDERTSAKAAGAVGAAVIAGVAFILVIFDFATLWHKLGRH